MTHTNDKPKGRVLAVTWGSWEGAGRHRSGVKRHLKGYHNKGGNKRELGVVNLPKVCRLIHAML